MLKKKENLFKLVLLSLFIAIMLVMDFTPLGYITTGAFSITLMTIPVALGAVCLGPVGALVLGVMFGLTSFLQAFGVGFMIDPMASVLFAENPLYYTLTCFVPRIVTALISAYIFLIFKRKNKINLWAFILSAAAVPIFNTLLFMTFYAVCYKNTVLGGTAVMTVILSALSLNFAIEFAVTLISGVIINKVIYNYLQKMSK